MLSQQGGQQLTQKSIDVKKESSVTALKIQKKLLENILKWL